MKAGILGVGRYIPEKVLTNHDLEQMVDTSDEWIRTRTGIEERRIAAEDMYSSGMAAEAAQKALDQAGISAEELDMILVATVTPDQSLPYRFLYDTREARGQKSVRDGYQRRMCGFYVRYRNRQTIH